MKILFYAINGVGLGHLNRCLVLADTIKEINPSINIIFVTNSLFTKPIERAGYHFTQLPKSREAGLLMDKKGFSLFKNIIDQEKPDLIVYDTYFYYRVVKYAAEIRKIKNILILRKIDNKSLYESYNTPFWHNWFNCIRLFDKILIPHSLGEFSTSNDIKILNKVVGVENVLFIGYICKTINDIYVEDIKKKYIINPKDFLITVSCGGGGKDENNSSPGKFLKSIIDAYHHLNNKIDNLRMIIIKGPYSDYVCDSVELVDYEPYLLELISLADLHISTASYNVCNEIIVAKTPAILFPIRRHNESQYQRAKFFTNYGFIRVVGESAGGNIYSNILDLYKSKSKLSVMKEKVEKYNLEIGNKKAATLILNSF